METGRILVRENLGVVIEIGNAVDCTKVGRPGLPSFQHRLRRLQELQRRAEWCHSSQLRFWMTDAQDITLMHNDFLRVSAQRMPGRVRSRRVVRACHAVAIVLQTVTAFFAMLAAFADATDANQITLTKT